MTDARAVFTVDATQFNRALYRMAVRWRRLFNPRHRRLMDHFGMLDD